MTSRVVRALASEPGAELRETHGSWVVLGAGRALKIKKPVAFSFLDYRSLEARRRACEEELRVNQELAPGIYRAVRPVYASPPHVDDGPRHDAPIDFAVEMRRYDERATMAALIRGGRLRETHVELAAARLARFHERAHPEGPHAPQPASWRARAFSDLADLAMLGIDVSGARRFADAAALRHHDVLHERWIDGLVRDGHGDLRAEHVLPTAPVIVVDRLEFDRDLRVADVADDLAFLTMDLERLDARWAADLLLEAYAAEGGPIAPPAVAALFAWRRALVRQKVALLSADTTTAATHGALAERLAWRARAPATIAVFGAPASGKSTVAGWLAERLELPVVSSDRLRKRRHGLAPEDRGDASLYEPEVTHDTYRALVEEARAAASTAGGVIVDATFGSADQRALLAAALPAPCWVRCDAPVEVLRTRAALRERSPDRVSDAGPAVAVALAARFEPPCELPGVLVLDTRRAPERLLAAVATRLDRGG